jgi:hypothetical protein
MTGDEPAAAPRRLRTYEEIAEAGRQLAKQLPPASRETLERVARILAPSLLAQAEGSSEVDSRPESASPAG